jgi:hypothetical protein
MQESRFAQSSTASTMQPPSVGVDDRSRIQGVMRSSISGLRRALFRLAYPSPVVYGFLLELRSFLHRISSLRTLYESGLDLGALVEPREH